MKGCWNLLYRSNTKDTNGNDIKNECNAITQCAELWPSNIAACGSRTALKCLQYTCTGSWPNTGRIPGCQWKWLQLWKWFQLCKSSILEQNIQIWFWSFPFYYFHILQWNSRAVLYKSDMENPWLFSKLTFTCMSFIAYQLYIVDIVHIISSFVQWYQLIANPLSGRCFLLPNQDDSIWFSNNWHLYM